MQKSEIPIQWAYEGEASPEELLLEAFRRILDREA